MMAHYKILGRDPYWMNFYGLMLLTAIEVGAVGADMNATAEALNMTEDGIRDFRRSRGLGGVYKRQLESLAHSGCDGRRCSSRRPFYTHVGSSQA